MKYGDFSSLVQLGVGLHAGTALLQLYGEFGLQPIERAMSRVRDVLHDKAPDDALHKQLSQVEAELAIFKIQLFNEYKRNVQINFGVAISLTICLVVISFLTEETLHYAVALFFFALSCLPAPATLFAFWYDASKQVMPLRKKLDLLEDAALRSF